MTPKRYSGSVVKRPFGVGSKSEHDAIFLVTKDGDYVLRRQGGNAFSDPEWRSSLVRRSNAPARLPVIPFWLRTARSSNDARGLSHLVLKEK